MGDKIPSKKSILILAIVIAVVMYLTGVFSGLYANKIMEHKVKQDLSKVEQDMDLLKAYIDSSSLDLKNIQLLQFFMDNIDQSCHFSQLYMSHLNDQLESYWRKLPSRLETYERENSETDEYITLKREYIRLSLRIWLIAQNNYNKCRDTDFIPLLYFYSEDCATCLEQGEILDSFREEMNLRNKSILVFAVDESFEDDTVFLLKQYYNLTKFPSIIVTNRIFQQDIISLEKLMDNIK